MTITALADVTNQIQKYWAPVFTKRLRESHMLAALCNKEYQGQILRQGDTVRVSQVLDPTGQLLTVGTDADSFATESVSTTYVDVTANKRAVAAYEFADLVELQSMIDRNVVQDPMIYAMRKKINDYLFTLVNPSTSAPDHLISGNAALDKNDLVAYRVLAGAAQWPQDGRWFGLLSPSYWGDLLGDTTLASGDYTEDKPMIAGQSARRLMGFNLFEDNSRTGTYGLFAHPDFLHYVEQSEVQVKISDKHSNNQFGFVMSVDIVFGAKLGNQGDTKHIKVYNT